jgi:ABC-type Fe3+ transport system substrate-binding protein
MAPPSMRRAPSRAVRTSAVVGVALMAVGGITVGTSAAAAGSGAHRSGARVSSLAALVKAAKAEKNFTIYAIDTPQQGQAWINGFDKTYGLEGGTYVRLISGPLEQRFLSEEAAHHDVADVVIDVDRAFFAANKKDFRPMSNVLVPGFGGIPTASRGSNFAVVVDNPFVVAYNTKLVKTSLIPRTWKSLTNPAYTGHTIINDPRSSPNYADWFYELGKQYGTGFLASIARLHYSVQQSGVNAEEALASGSAWINFPTLPVFVKILPKGAPVSFVVPNGTSFVTSQQAAVATGAPDPARARLFIHWLLSPQGLAVTCEPQWGSSVPPGFANVKGCLPQSKSPYVTDVGLTTAQSNSLFHALGLP